MKQKIIFYLVMLTTIVGVDYYLDNQPSQGLINGFNGVKEIASENGVNLNDIDINTVTQLVKGEPEEDSYINVMNSKYLYETNNFKTVEQLKKSLNEDIEKLQKLYNIVTDKKDSLEKVEKLIVKKTQDLKETQKRIIKEVRNGTLHIKLHGSI